MEHRLETLLGQRIFGLALGYEDLNDHDELRKNPVFAVLAGKLKAHREDCEPVAGKSTLNRLELLADVARVAVGWTAEIPPGNCRWSVVKGTSDATRDVA